VSPNSIESGSPNRVVVSPLNRVINGLKIHYVEAGEGLPVFLLHWFPDTWFAWRHQTPVLAKHYRVIAAGHRGYSRTPTSQPTNVEVPKMGIPLLLERGFVRI
jgi:pimeloyl-ACP methyl ester carboxylesterase